jgi:hypothetical protein
MSSIRRKPIPDFPNYYAGNDGNVYRKKNYGYRPIKPWHDRDTYANIVVSINGKKSRQFSHRLVALGFKGKPAKDKVLLRHLDGNRQNNVPRNLKWGDYRENWRDRKRHARIFAKSKNAALKNSSHR